MTIPVRWGLGSLLGPSAPAALVAAVLAFASPVHAALITAGTPTTHVPAGLADPLAKLADPPPEPLPEPSSMGLLGAALLALGATRRRRPWAPAAPRAARSITSRTQR
jgi:hypothetical protein